MKTSKTLFWVLTAAVVVFFFGTYVKEWFWGRIFLVNITILFLLGAALTYSAWKEKKRNKFMLLTGASMAGFFVFVMLHNFLYALGIITENIFVLHYLFEALHVIAFFIAVIVCPIAFLVGVIGTIIAMVKKR